MARAFGMPLKSRLHFLHLCLPDIVKKYIYSFVEDCTTTTGMGNVMGPKFNLLSGVPQESIQSYVIHPPYNGP